MTGTEHTLSFDAVDELGLQLPKSKDVDMKKEADGACGYCRFLLVGMVVTWGFALGFSAMTGNHWTKLLPGLRLLDEDFLAEDWSVNNAHDWQFFFDYTVAALFVLSPAGWALAAANALVLALGAYIVVAITTRLAPRETKCLAGVAVLCYLAVATPAGPGMNFLFSPVLEPTSFAALFLLCATHALVFGRARLAGAFLCFSGLAHPNFAVMLLPVVGLWSLLQREQSGRQRAVSILRNSLWLLAPLAFYAPWLIGIGADPHRAEAHHIYMNVRAPHHYITLQWVGDFLPLVGAVGAGLLFSAAQGSRASMPMKQLGRLVVSMTLVVAIAFVLTTLVFVDSIARLHLFRLTPVLSVLSWVLAIVGYLRLKESAQSIRVQVVTALLGGGFLLLVSPTMALLHIVLLGLVVQFREFFSTAGSRAVFRRVLLVCPFALAFSLSVASEIVNNLQRSHLVYDIREDREQLYQWVNLHLEPDSLLLVPPYMLDFRLHARRAIFVDWKMVPVNGPEIREWYRRIGLVSGIEEPRGARDVFDAYHAREGYDLVRVAREQCVTHVVMRHTHYSRLQNMLDEAAIRDIGLAYTNGVWALLDIRSSLPPFCAEPRVSGNQLDSLE